MEDIISVLNLVFDGCHSDADGLVPCSVILEELQKEYSGNEEDCIKLQSEIEAVMGSRITEKLSKVEFVRLMTNAVDSSTRIDGISPEDNSMHNSRVFTQSLESSATFEYCGLSTGEPTKHREVETSLHSGAQTENRLLKVIEENVKLSDIINMKEMVIAQLRQKTRDLENFLLQAENEESLISSLKDKIIEKNVQIKCLNEDYAICKEKLDNMVSTEQKIEQLEKQKNNLTQELNDKQKELLLLLEEIDAKNQRCLELENKIGELNDRLIGENWLFELIACLGEEKKQLHEQLDKLKLLTSPNYVVELDGNSFEESSPTNLNVSARFNEMSIDQELALVHHNHLALMKPVFLDDRKEMKDIATSCVDDFNVKLDCSTQTSTSNINYEGVQTGHPYAAVAVTRSFSAPGNYYHYTFHLNQETRLNPQARKSLSWMLCLFALFSCCVAICYQLDVEIWLSDWFVNLLKPKLSFKRGIPPF